MAASVGLIRHKNLKIIFKIKNKLKNKSNNKSFKQPDFHNNQFTLLYTKSYQFKAN